MRNRHRIFIAINLPENIKETLFSYHFKWPDLPARWTKKDNLHITLLFLGYLKSEQLSKLFEMVKKIFSRHRAFSLILNKIVYAPKNQKIPKMIWVEIKESQTLTELQEDIENNLADLFSSRLFNQKGYYRPHITLARLRQWEFKMIEPEERPDINEEINLKFEVKSIEIMESHLKRKGPEYSILQSFSLQ
jgi:2'-5' RNA ligase